MSFLLFFFATSLWTSSDEELSLSSCAFLFLDVVRLFEDCLFLALVPLAIVMKDGLGCGDFYALYLVV
jgi:hypothetical protein